MPVVGSDVAPHTLCHCQVLVICRVMKMINTYKSYWTFVTLSWWFLIVMPGFVNSCQISLFSFQSKLRVVPSFYFNVFPIFAGRLHCLSCRASSSRYDIRFLIYLTGQLQRVLDVGRVMYFQGGGNGEGHSRLNWIQVIP